jgi:hypothetical protein
MTILCCNSREEAALAQMYRTLRVAESDEGVLNVVIDAPPMNLIGPELVRDLVRLLGEVESGQDVRVIVLESADPEYFVPHGRAVHPGPADPWPARTRPRRPHRSPAAAKVPCLAAPGRSRPALDGHHDAAAEAQLGTDELSVLQQAVTHHGQGRPKLLIGVACEVHVVHDDDATLAKRGHSPAQLEDLPAGRVREYQVKQAEPADCLGPVPRLEANPRRPARRKRRLLHRSIELNRDDLHVLARSQAMDQPGKPDTDAGADLQDPATAGDRRGQGGQQSAHFDLAGEPETGSGGSLVPGQNVFGKLLALGHPDHTAKHARCLLDGDRPQPAAAAYRGAARLPGRLSWPGPGNMPCCGRARPTPKRPADRGGKDGRAHGRTSLCLFPPENNRKQAQAVPAGGRGS